MSILTRDVQPHWAVIAPILTIRNDEEYEKAVESLNELLDEIGDDETHPLYGLLDALGTLVHAYEEKNEPLSECSSVEMLRFFMEEHHLSEADLPEVGSQKAVAEILSGRQELSIEQIRALANRFHVSPAVFV